MKQVFLIGGPNGAGKTTAAMTLLPNFLSIYEFVNADEIAHGLNPLNPEGQAIAAARIMLERMQQLTSEQKSFAFETTCAGSSHLARLATCKAKGYNTILMFLWLPNAEMAIRRVESRVKQGGHSIAAQVIRRRYAKGLYNLVKFYLPAVDSAVIYDNSNGVLPHDLPVIAEKKQGQQLQVHDMTLWQRIKENANA